MLFFAVPADHRMKIREIKKRVKYLELAREMKNVWNVRVTVIVIVVGAHRRDRSNWKSEEESKLYRK